MLLAAGRDSLAVSDVAGAGAAASASDASEGEEAHQRIIEAVHAGESRSAIARVAGVSRQWVSRLLE
jgi:hypothetical protein